MSDNARLLVYGKTTASDRGSISTYEAPWAEIVNLFRKPVVRKITTAQYLAMDPKGRASSKNTGLFFGGRCSNGARSSETLVSRSIINLDLDDNCQAIWDELQITGGLSGLDGITYFVHTTRSHSEAAPKMRILVPASRDLLPAEYEPCARALAHRIDPSMRGIAGESYVVAQGMYFPSVSSDQLYEVFENDADLFDVDAALARYPADDASKWPRREFETVTVYVPGRCMSHPESKKAQAPIITAVHRAFDPWSFIEEFLPDVYVASGDRYAPYGASGAPSVRIYDGAFIHSDHGSDAAVGQHNTFDLGRIHLFGHLDTGYDTANISPTEWPSYRAMADFMLQRSEVQDCMAEVLAEVEVERNLSALQMLDDLDDDADEDDDADTAPVGSATGNVANDDDYAAMLDELLGATPVAKQPSATTEDILRKIRKSLAKATDLSDLERRLETIRALPLQTFNNLHRDLVTANLQSAFLELAGEKITKTTARQMLAPTVENLRDQVAGEAFPKYLQPWVYLSGENKMFNLVTKQLLSTEGFNGLYAVETGERFGVNKLGVPMLSPSLAALAVYGIPKPYRTRYVPGGADLFEEDGVSYANSYRRAVVPAGGYSGNRGVQLLTRLIRNLLPDLRDRSLLMDFIVHIVTKPNQKLRYALLIKGSEDEGKTLIAELVSTLLGFHNCSIIGSDQLKEKFNSWSFERIFAVVEEIKIPGREAYDVLNKIKPVITNSRTPIRRMNNDTTTEDNFCNLFLTTNHEDCLPLEEDNSRFLVLFTRFRNNQEVKDYIAQCIAEDGSYYVTELYHEIKERPAQFLEAFSKYKFSEWYAPSERAPSTRYKAMMAEDGKTEERLLVEGLLESGEDPTITPDLLIWSSVKAELDAAGIGQWLRNRAIAGFLKPLGFLHAMPVTARVAGKVRKISVWTRNPALLDDQNVLTPEGLQKARDAIEAKESLDGDDASLIALAGANVVQLKTGRG